jgi:two-component system sensor histidine kinase/response regulator
MLIGFYNDYQDFREKFITSCKSSDATAATRFAHSLKSCAGNIGATSVQTLAERLEQACKTGIQSGAFAELIDETATEIAVIRKELAKVVEQAAEPVPEKRPRDYDKVRFESVRGQLQSLLLESDSDAISVLEQNKEILQSAMNSHFDELAKLVRDYDFEAALSLIEKENSIPD